MDARGADGWLHSVWSVAGSPAMAHLLEFSGYGSPPVRWFSRIDPTHDGRLMCGRGFDQDPRSGSIAEHRRKALGLAAGLPLDQFACLGEITDLAGLPSRPYRRLP